MAAPAYDVQIPPGGNLSFVGFAGPTPDGSGGTFKVTSEIAFYLANWAAPDHGIIDLVLVTGSKRDSSDASAVNTAGQYHYDLWPGDIASLALGDAFQGSAVFQCVNNGTIPVGVRFHDRPA